MTQSIKTHSSGAERRAQPRKMLVSILLPVYNEAAVLRQNVEEIISYLQSLRGRYRFEILIVDDGSTDGSADVARLLAAEYAEIRLLRHPVNFGVGQALKYGFSSSAGDYVVVLDADLSYEPNHIAILLDRLEATKAKVVLASAHMPGGRVTNVPWLRRFLSVSGNRFLRLLARSGVSTLTCMVRAYDGPYIRSLVLRSTGLAIMPEIIRKTMILQGRIKEVPAHLDWSRQINGTRRTSSTRIVGQIRSTALSGFLFRPVLFLIVPGLLVMAFALYVNAWMIIHFFDAFAAIPADVRTPSAAFALAFNHHPHTFTVAFLSLMLAILLVGLGVISLQAQKYFEELFHLGSVARRTADQGSSTRGQLDPEDLAS